MIKHKFSTQLSTWLNSPGSKTVDKLEEVFGIKSFAIAVLLLMFVPALPLPTGGLTHIFEIITALLCLEMIVGRSSIWLPERWRKKQIGGKAQKKALPFMVRRIKWFEKFSRPRMESLINNKMFLRLIGLVMLVLTVTAFVAPPFSGLDTLPALGVVVVALSIILEDVVLLLIGMIIGSIGIATVVATGTVVWQSFKHFI